MSCSNKKNKKIVAESIQLNEGAIEAITALAKKIPGINKYYQIAQSYKPQLLQILKTSKSGKEVKEKMEQLVAQHPVSVAESYYDSAVDSYKSQLKSARLTQLGGLAAMGGSILTTMWMNAMGLIDGVLARAATGEMGGAIAAGAYLGLIPIMYIVLGTMLMFRGASKGDEAKQKLADLNLKNAQATQSKQPARPSMGNSSIQQDRKKYETLVSSIPPNAVILKTKNVTKWDNWVKLVNSYHFNGQAVIKSGSKGKIAIGNGAVWGKWDFTAQNGQVNIKGKPLKTKNVGESRSNIGSQHEISWVDLGEDLSVEDKMRIVEEYALKGNLTESLDEDKKDYFISLFAMSDEPVLKNQYIVASLALVGNKIMNLGVYPNSKFLGKTNHIMLFNVNGEKKSFPTKTMRDLSMFNTFTFSTVDAYDKFKVALAMKFDASLPAIAAENIKESKNTMNNTKYVGLETKEGTWRVFKSGQAVAVAGPFKSAEEARAWIKTAEKENKNKQGVAEAAKWRSNPNAHDIDDEGNKSPKTANKFSYDPLAYRQDTAGDAKTVSGKKSALKTSIKMAKGQHGPKGILPESDMAEGLTKQARAKKEAESVKAAIERLEQQLKDPNPYIDKDSIRRRLENEKNRLELYRDVLDEQGVTEGEKINELSPKTLASYKKKAGAAASEADKRGDFEKGHKRFKGIIKATKKEFENDLKNIKENGENMSDKKTDAKIAALEKKIKDTQDAIGLARERRKMKGQRQQGTREMTLGSKLDDLRQQMHMLKAGKKTTVNEDRYYDEAERTLADAKIAKENGDMGDYYTLMADYHDFMAQWHERKGRYGAADRDAEKAKQYHDAAIKYSVNSTVNEDGLIGNPTDKVTMDVPLMIRIMEYAREDAQSDMDLHDVAEQLIKLSASGKTLTMQDYNSVVRQQTENKIFELGATNTVPTAQTTKPMSPTTSTATQQTQGNTQPATTTTTSSTIKPAGATSSPTTSGAAKPGASNLKPEEQEALNKIMTNAGLKTQFQQLVQKSKTVPGA